MSKALTLADHLAAARAKRRPMTKREGARMSEIMHAKQFLARLRKIKWPKEDVLTCQQVAFVLNISRQGVSSLLARGELPYTRATGTPGRPAYLIATVDLHRYVDQRVAAARELAGESD